MPEIIPSHVPSPRTLLAWDGTAYRPIHIDALGNVQIDVVASALPAGAATAAAQALALAQLQLIEDMRDALQSVATDRLIVRGEDQLFSFRGVLASTRTAAISGPGGYVDSNPCAAGEIWCVTGIATQDATSPTTAHAHQLRHDGANYRFDAVVAAIAAGQWVYWGGWKWLDPADVVRVGFIGGLGGDTCTVTLTGYRMTLEA